MTQKMQMSTNLASLILKLLKNATMYLFTQKTPLIIKIAKDTFLVCKSLMLNSQFLSLVLFFWSITSQRNFLRQT
jgi:hypothetical protein